MKKIFALTLLSAAVIASGCSSDDDDDDGMTTGGGTTTTGGTTGNTDGDMMPTMATLPAGTDYDSSTLDPVPTLNLLELASGVDSLSSLVGAAGNCPDIVAALQDPDARLTVFAPNNDAFAAAEVQTALAAPDADACAVISNHVLVGTVADAAALGGDNVGATADTLGDNDIVLGTNADAGVTVNGATVVGANNFATNGVAHIIDAVLLEAPTTGGTTGGDTGDTGGDTGDDGMTGGGSGGANEAALSGNANYSSFTETFRTTLGGPSIDDPANTWTVFAVDNAAFDMATFDVQDHVLVGEKLTADILGTRTSITTNAGASYDVANNNGVITVGGNTVTVISEEGTSIVYGIDGQL